MAKINKNRTGKEKLNVKFKTENSIIKIKNSIIKIKEFIGWDKKQDRGGNRK